MSPKLVPLPAAPAGGMQQLLFGDLASAPLPAPPPPRTPAPLPSEALLQSLVSGMPGANAAPVRSDEDIAAVVGEVLRALVDDPDSAGRSASVLYQDFTIRCRMGGVSRPPFDLAEFTRRLAMARAGLFDLGDASWYGAIEAARALPDDMLGPFLLLARAAKDRAPCPSDEAIAASYGTASLGRVRRLLTYIESRELIVSRVDLSGKRSIAIPSLGWATAAA